MIDLYEVRTTAPAARALYTYPPRIADAVLAFCEGALAADPYGVTHELAAEVPGVRAANIGTAFRLLASVDDEARVVYVYRVSLA